jgi:hypothetical protein
MSSLRAIRSTARAAAVGLALAVLATCSGGTAGIFYTLATQTSRENRNLDDNLAVANIVYAGDRYYVAAASIYRTAKIGETWDQVNNPPAGDDDVVQVRALAYYGGYLYAAFHVEGASSVYRLYRASPASSSLDWKDLEFGEQVVRLLVVGDGDKAKLLAITADAEAGTGALYDLSDGGPAEMVLAERARDAAWDGTDYWITTADAIYRGPDLSALDTAAVTAPARNGNDAEYSGVIVVDAYVYVADGNGNLHWAAITPTATADPTDAADPAPPAEALVWMSDSVTAEDDALTEFGRVGRKILVGTQSQGFYAFDVESTGAPLPLSPGREGVRVTRHPHFTNEQLYKAHVLRFAVLPDAEEPDYLFALTATDGLFSTTPDSLDIWNQE